jgi:hypothetical protein
LSALFVLIKWPKTLEFLPRNFNLLVPFHGVVFDHFID